MLLASLVTNAAWAQDAPEVGRLFSREADLTSPGDGPYRLALSAEVLAACQPGLSDLRLYDGDGREVPWLLDDAGRVPTGTSERLLYVTAPALDATRTREGPPRAPTGFVETFAIAPPGEAPPRSEWSLLFDVRSSAFVAAIRVIETGADGTERELAETSIYRMQAPTRERLRVVLREAPRANVRVEIRGQDGFLEPLLGWEATRRVRDATAMTIPLEIAEQRSEGGRTILVVTRPPGTLPDRLHFTTSTLAFARPIRIDDTSSFSGQIYRVPSVRGAESLDVPVAQLRQATFTVTIENGDSPPLEGLSVSAILAQPALVFFQPATLVRFGGGRVRAPRYDLDALSGSWMIDRLVDGSMTPTDAVLGPARPSPAWDAAPALAFLHRPGVPVLPSQYRFTAPLNVGAAPEGASRFQLHPSALSALDPGRGDLRIVDAESRQWPYLVTGQPEVTMPLTVGAPSRDGDETRYALALPVERASLRELRFVADAALIARVVRVVGTDERGDQVTLATGRLDHAPAQTEPMAIALSDVRVTELSLVVEDGDEAPLVFSSIEASLTTSEIFLIAPAGAYSVLIGDEGGSAPSYDIEHARDLLVAIPPAEATLGALVQNPAHRTPGLIETAGIQTIALWAVLLLAVLVLGLLTWRASREPAPETTAAAPSTAAPAPPEEPGQEPPPA